MEIITSVLSPVGQWILFGLMSDNHGYDVRGRDVWVAGHRAGQAGHTWHTTLILWNSEEREGGGRVERVYRAGQHADWPQGPVGDISVM